MAMRDYRLMALFVAIADAGSVRAAARRIPLWVPLLDRLGGQAVLGSTFSHCRTS